MTDEVKELKLENARLVVRLSHAENRLEAVDRRKTQAEALRWAAFELHWDGVVTTDVLEQKADAIERGEVEI